jgi:hypothetical protein
MEKELTINNLGAKIETAQIFIEGDGDLVLHKMNARNERMLMADDRKKLKEVPNIWEDIITEIHWRDPLPVTDTYTECTEELMGKLLQENAPCISAFGLKKSFCQAVVRNIIDKYSTKIDNAVNVVADRGLVPIKFAQWSLERRLMSPVKGAPISVTLNHFSGWSANFTIMYTEHVYSFEKIVNIINLAGFGLGIGSGRSSGFGRYHIVEVRK